MSNTFIFPEEIWKIIKDFLPTWKNNHSRKLNKSLEARYFNTRMERKSKFWMAGRQLGIKALYPKKIITEEYNLSLKVYISTFKLQWNNKIEKRTANYYEVKENSWIDSYLLNGGYNIL